MMDNMIISGIRIYFTKSEEPLPTPEKRYADLSYQG
jgi:hypothetical protein